MQIPGTQIFEAISKKFTNPFNDEGLGLKIHVDTRDNQTPVYYIVCKNADQSSEKQGKKILTGGMVFNQVYTLNLNADYPLWVEKPLNGGPQELLEPEDCVERLLDVLDQNDYSIDTSERSKALFLLFLFLLHETLRDQFRVKENTASQLERLSNKLANLQMEFNGANKVFEELKRQCKTRGKEQERPKSEYKGLGNKRRAWNGG
jgi:hypothetical protein